jgi:branched-chain amino acid transport system substrate-binding protein
MQFPGVMEFLKKYQERASAEGVDLLGYYLPPWAYADLQVLGEAVEETKSLDHAKLAQYMHAHTFKNVTFGESGEWTNQRTLEVQFQNIKGNDVKQFLGIEHEVILEPNEYASGKVIYPFAAARP